MEEIRLHTSSLESLDLTMLGQPLHTLTETELMRHVNVAFKQYHTVLALARSPLAHSSLIKPLLILDELSPDVDKRAAALRLVLQWAVDGLQPEPSQYPLGSYRPYEDPTWQDPRWWRYNILRHRYLEPLHPDEFVEGGRFTETLMALTGIPSSDLFFDERNRAVREVTQRLRQELLHGNAANVLRRRALQRIYQPLQQQPTALALLGIAATFTEPFAQAHLFSLANDERLEDIELVLQYLIEHRLLLLETGTMTLWLSPILQVYVYARQSVRLQRRRHQRLARIFEREQMPVLASVQWQKAEQWDQAALVLLESAAKLINELQTADLQEALEAITLQQLSMPVQRDVQILLADLYYQGGQFEAALAACRRALQTTKEPLFQARIYRRMGKLYEKNNQLHALTYYQQAEQNFPATHAELIDLYKDRGWLQILRRNWAEAIDDLENALALLPEGEGAVLADIYDALATVHREQKQFDQAVDYASQALTLREESGNFGRIADSFGNLGSLYLYMGDYAHAITAYQEALATYRKLNNKERISGALLNLGTANHLNGRLPTAIDYYQQGLAVCREIDLPHTEATALHNLAEALAEQGHVDVAQAYWQEGHRLSKESQFEDQLGYFTVLQERFPFLATVLQQTSAELVPEEKPVASEPVRLPPLLPDEQAAISLARENGRLTPKDLMQAVKVSKATATRRLADLVEKGLLEKYGKGRGTYYAVPQGLASNEEWRAALKKYQAVWLVRFGLVRLGLLPRGDAENRLNLVAQFKNQPDLEMFFELETKIAEAAGVAVDLKPITAVNSLQSITWLEK